MEKETKEPLNRNGKDGGARSKIRMDRKSPLPPARVVFFFFLPVAEISSHTGQSAVAFFSSPPLLRATSCMTTAFMVPLPLSPYTSGP